MTDTAGLESLLITGSLDDPRLLEATEAVPDERLLPDVTVLKLGGQSLIDRGREAIFPVLDEIVAAIPEYRLLIGTGGGTRARHAYSLAAQLGLPTGVLTEFGSAVAGQNTTIIGHLLAKHGIPIVDGGQQASLPLRLADVGAAIFSGMPPYDMWQPLPEEGVIPPYRTDAGVYLVGETYGCKQVIFVKDEDGLFTANPKTDPSAELIPEITVDELIARDLPDLIVERPLLELLPRARFIRSIQIINGLVPGNLTRALAGEHVGTIISA